MLSFNVQPMYVFSADDTTSQVSSITDTCPVDATR